MGTSLKHIDGHAPGFVHSENEDARSRTEGNDTGCRFKAAHPWHGDVQDDDVRLEIGDRVNGFLGSRSFTANLPVRARSKKRTKPLAHNIVIIDNQNSRGHKSVTYAED